MFVYQRVLLLGSRNHGFTSKNMEVPPESTLGINLVVHGIVFVGYSYCKVAVVSVLPIYFGGSQEQNQFLCRIQSGLGQVIGYPKKIVVVMDGTYCSNVNPGWINLDYQLEGSPHLLNVPLATFPSNGSYLHMYIYIYTHVQYIHISTVCRCIYIYLYVYIYIIYIHIY